MKKHKYDVAISFAGEQRDYAQALASKLSALGICLFLADWEYESLWGNNLNSIFASVFNIDALYSVAIFSKEYKEKVWTRYEFEMMQNREKEDAGYILPILFDGTRPDYWPDSRGYIDAKSFSVDEIALMIRGKIREKKKEESVSCNSSEPDIGRKIITLTGENGDTETVEVILAFKFRDSGKEYVVYTKEERDCRGNYTIYVSNVDRSEKEPKLKGVADEDWIKVKEVLWELSKDDNASDNEKIPLIPFYDVEGNEIL